MRFFIVVFLGIISNGIFSQNKTEEFSSVLLLMGTRFEIKAITSSVDSSRMAVEACVLEVKRIERILSPHIEGGDTWLVNANAGIRPVKVSYEMFTLIKRSAKISALTGGAFDISFGAMLPVWNFKTLKKLPDSAEVARVHRLVDYRKIVLNEHDTTVFLPEKGMAIGFGANGKGYAANRGKMVMLKLGAQSGFVNAAGDILFWGHNIDGKPWRVAITNPFDEHKVFGWLDVTNMAVVTSGDYENFVDIGGMRYSHIIDARTGWPTTSTHSVTIVCPDGEIADALATSVSAMGPEEGLSLINQLKGIECLIVKRDGTLVQSKNLKLEAVK